MKSNNLRVVGPPDPESGGPDEEFVALMTSHQTALLAFLLSLVPNKSDAEDILQKTNVVLWRKRESFELGTSFRAWAFTVARWEARAFLKERKGKSWLLYDDAVAGLLADRIASVPRHEMEGFSTALGTCLGKLSETNRALVVNIYQRGMSYGECGKELRRSVAGLRVTLHRIRASLRKCIVRELKGGRG